MTTQPRPFVMPRGLSKRAQRMLTRAHAKAPQPEWRITRTTPMDQDERFGLFVNEALVQDDFYSRIDAERAAFHLGLPGAAS